MAIEEGSFVKLEFTGKVAETGDVFDTTNEEIAKEAGIYVENKDYGPIPVIVGGEHLLKAIDAAVIGMEKGEKKKIEVSVEDGFGERDSNLIQLIPMKDFKKQGMNPYPGMELTMEGNTGRILTVSGGRVRVDFNHALAGKNTEYDIELIDVITDDVEKIKSMIQLHYSYPNMDIEKTEVNITDGVAKIKLDEITRFDQKSYMDITFARFRISKDIWDNIDSVEKVEFVDVFEDKAADEESNESSEEQNESEE